MKRMLVLLIAIPILLLLPRAFGQKLLTTVPVGGQPGYLAVNAATNMIYVPNETHGTLTVIDGGTNKVVANVPVGEGADAAAVNPITNMVYVANTGGTPSVTVVDGSSNVVVATIPATSPGVIAVNPATNMVYVANGAGAAISVIDGSSNEIVDTFSTSHCCIVQGIAINSVTNRIYVAENGTSEQVVVIDGGTNKFVAFQVPGVCDLRGVAVDTSLNRIYVTDDICGGLYVISGVTNKTVATISGYFGPSVVNPSTQVVGDFDLNVLSFVNARTNATVGGSVTFPKTSIAQNIAAGSNNRYFVSLRKTNGIAVVSGPAISGGQGRR